MPSNIDIVVLNISNYVSWAPNMGTLLNRKGSSKYMKISILDPTYYQEKFIVYGKKDEAVGVIMTYISREIRFHINGIDFPHQVWKKMKSLFDQVDESHAM
jgi:hypothetical protein